MPTFQTESPPVLLLGGIQNSLAIVRSLGEKNILVRVAARAPRPALRSRFCTHRYHIPPGEAPDSYWGNLLLGGSRSDLQGSVIFACDDFAVTFLAKHRAELQNHYILDNFIPSLQLAMLDKQRTLELARSAGCAVPQFWKVDTLEDLRTVHSTAKFPIMVKPIHSHMFESALGRKFFIAHSHRELDEQVRQVFDRQLRIMVCEIIPGRDSTAQSSYYTYIDSQGRQLFRFTKRVLRRTPEFGGRAVLHKTEWLPETAEVGERFFRGIGFRGLGHIEFKRDHRDGQLKIIECNPRFTEAQELLQRCGLDTAYLVYRQLTGRPVSPTKSYTENLFLWYPVRDLIDQWKGRHGLSAGQWLKSVFHWKTVFPYFSWQDPWPSCGLAVDELERRLQGRKLARTKQAEVTA